MINDEKATETIEKFADKFISSQKGIEPEIQEIINEHFDELLDDCQIVQTK